MLILIARFLSGYLKIRIDGYSPERFLNLCSHHGIYLWNLKSCGHAYEMDISVRGFRRLKPIIRKTGTKVIIKERRGFPFFLHKYRRRKLFFAGIFCCIVSIYLMSLFIWDIDIEGNKSRTDEVILEFLDSQNISHGMRRASVNCDRIVKDIRKEYDDIIWVSAYVKGTKLFIRIKENSDRNTEKMDAENTEVLETSASVPVDIVADKDGVILQIITRSGVPQVHEGDKVKKGDVLVSGTVGIMNDAGEAEAYRYCRADADIVAQTELEYEDTVPLQYEVKEFTGKKSRKIWLETKNTVYTLGRQKNPFQHSTSETSAISPRLGEHFWMPFSFGYEIIREYRPAEKKYTQKEYQAILNNNFTKFCKELEKKGVQILENNVKIYREAVRASARGTLKLSEAIGIEQEGNLTYGNSGDND